MLSYVQDRLKGLVRSTWASDEEMRGQLVALYRQYYEGEHRAKLTPEMRAMLRLDGLMDRFNVNYCDLVASSLANRLTVVGIEGDTPDATQWARDVMDATRFDALQMDVHESALVDGDTYVMIVYNKDTDMIDWAHEPAYDGDTGMVVVYDRTRKNIVAAIKIWYEGDDRCLNLYTNGTIEKLKLWTPDPKKGETTPQLVERKPSEEMKDQQGEKVNVPVIHFKNRGKTSDIHGKSELINIIPPQDVLNRVLTSMVMTSELSAFQIPIAIGFKPPAALMPGAWIVVPADGTPLNKEDVVKVDVLQQAQLVPFIDEANFIIEQIVNTSQTPLVGGGEAGASGEALKQRAEGQVSKAQAAQVRFGNTWEDGMAMSVSQQKAYGLESPPPETGMWKTIWKDAQTRNEDNVIKNAMLTRDVVGERETMRVIGSVRGYDEAKIDALMKEKDEEAASKMNQMSLPGFDQFGANTDLRQPAQQPAQQNAADPNNARVIDPAALQEALALEASA